MSTKRTSKTHYQKPLIKIKFAISTSSHNSGLLQTDLASTSRRSDIGMVSIGSHVAARSHDWQQPLTKTTTTLVTWAQRARTSPDLTDKENVREVQGGQQCHEVALRRVIESRDWFLRLQNGHVNRLWVLSRDWPDRYGADCCDMPTGAGLADLADLAGTTLTTPYELWAEQYGVSRDWRSWLSTVWAGSDIYCHSLMVSTWHGSCHSADVMRQLQTA